MSYILEALRRSQAERERGQVPGLNAQPAAVAALPTQREAVSWRWLLPAGLGALAVVALSLWLWRTPASPPAVVAVPAPAPVPASAVLPSPTPLPVVVSAPPPAPATQAPAVAAAPVPVPSASAPAATPRTVRLSELSAEQRRELPPLSLGGSVWSESALSRFVIVNGQVVREGDTAAPGVVVDRIGPKAVWLRWRELRLELAI
jgi:general secretion pathway protein B